MGEQPADRHEGNNSPIGALLFMCHPPSARRRHCTSLAKAVFRSGDKLIAFAKGVTLPLDEASANG
jgi:hypothetical protein